MTDYRAFLAETKCRTWEAKITCCFLAVQPFDFDVLYWLGELNYTTSFLSRMPHGHPEGGRMSFAKKKLNLD